jgi:hypothetical protein
LYFVSGVYEYTRESCVFVCVFVPLHPAFLAMFTAAIVSVKVPI